MVKRWMLFTCYVTIQNSLEEAKRIHENFELNVKLKNAILTNHKSSSILIIKHLCIFLKKNILVNYLFYSIWKFYQIDMTLI